jgi:hypothetical protein
MRQFAAESNVGAGWRDTASAGWENSVSWLDIYLLTLFIVLVLLLVARARR